jgi:hypothetical protein
MKSTMYTHKASRLMYPFKHHITYPSKENIHAKLPQNCNKLENGFWEIGWLR